MHGPRVTIGTYICNTISRDSKSGSRQTAMVGKTAVIKSTDADVTNQIA